MAALRIAPGLMARLTAYRWPGNVRELENAIERMIVLSNGEAISEDDLPTELHGSAPAAGPSSFLLDLPEEGISLEAVERELLLRALERFNGNQTQAARYLDISRRTLIYRMEKHGLRAEGDADPEAEA